MNGFLTLALMLVAGPDDDARAALALAAAQVKPAAPTVIVLGPNQPNVYRAPNPLYVVSGQFKVSTWNKGKQWYKTAFPLDWSDLDIVEHLGELNRTEVRQAPRPFLKRLFLDPARRQTVDDEGEAGGPWPEDVDFPDGAVLYRPAQFTQSIFTSNNASAIQRVHRSALLPKWQVPGGMENVVGWRSDLYKIIPTDRGRTWQGMIPVLNSFGYFQHELGHLRSYPDGTVFFDVLSNAETGKVFEHRERRKSAGEWTSQVVFRDRSQYPPGYKGLRGQTCFSCHSEAGTGGYSTGLVPGGDTVLSDPFPGLE